MAENKKSFIMYLTQRPTFDGLSDEEAGQLIKTIFSYVSDENPEPTGIIKYAFEIIKPVLKADLVKYEDIRKAKSEGGKKHKGNQYTLKDSGTERNKMEDTSKNGTDGTVIDNDIVNVNDNVLSKDNNKENNTTMNSSVKEKPTTSRFYPPTLDEIKAYCNERNNLVDPDRFYDFYSAKGWMVGKNKMKDWKAAVRTWEKEAGFKKIENNPFQELGESDEDYQRRLLNGGFNEI